MTDPSSQPVVDVLREQIAVGVLHPRERLVEAELAERFGVRRATIRAAIIQLGTEGLVVHEPHRGARVRSYSLDEAIDIIEARLALQALQAQKAAERGTPDERRELLEALEGYRTLQTADPSLQAMAGHRMFDLIERMSRHEAASRIVDKLGSNNLSGAPYVVPEVRDHVTRNNERIVGAVLARDADAAFWATLDQLETVVRAMESRRDAAFG